MVSSAAEPTHVAITVFPRTPDVAEPPEPAVRRHALMESAHGVERGQSCRLGR